MKTRWLDNAWVCLLGGLTLVAAFRGRSAELAIYVVGTALFWKIGETRDR